MRGEKNMNINWERYSRQMRFAGIGQEGQRRLLESCALVVGCGALGSVAANILVRAGVGKVRIVDRDFLELNNLQRQVLYDEQDVASGLPKAVCAAQKLRQINHDVEVEPVVADLNANNIQQLLDGVHVIVDGTDNFETRFLINDASLRYKIPWVYGGCLGSEGQTLTILPGDSACLRCLMPEPPPPGVAGTCDTAGILGPIVQVIAAWEAMEAIKILLGQWERINRDLIVIDVWDNQIRRIPLKEVFTGFEQCACHGADFPWLEGRSGTQTAVLCGRNAVQLSFPGTEPVRLEELAQRLSSFGKVSVNRFLLKLELEKHTLTVFRDGRTIVSGTDDVAEARSLHARYIGN
ncbi:MAG: molybdopterin biosynthesis protein MoeB [Pirellulaceae bacterium]|nr:MAG: molybdopterin biosynthesis protein MoeB [Pirellulaceae bacterium]